MVEFYRGEPRSALIFDETGRSIDSAFEIKGHSKKLGWGYCSKESAQAAFAILYDYTKDISIANSYYQEFKKEILTNFALNDEFILTADDIETFLSEVEQC